MVARAGRMMVLGATLLLLLSSGALAADETCARVLEGRVRACTEACVAKARAAVAPEIRDRITGRGCANNCAKLEMFNGHSCP